MQAVASRNNDRTVAGKSFAWRLLGMMPSISKAATVSQTDDWRSDRRTRLYHSCIDILVQQINDLSGRDIHFRFGINFIGGPVFFWIFSAWTAMKCQVQLCVQPHSAHLVGVLRASCLTPTLYSRSGTQQMCGKGLLQHARNCWIGMDDRAIAAKNGYCCACHKICL